MPFAREIRLLSLALLDSTSGIRPLTGGIQSNVHGPASLRSICSWPFTKFGLTSNFQKMSLPQLATIPMARMHTEVLNNNMTIKRSNIRSDDGKSSGNSKKLTVMLSWMMAKGKHLEKYADIYLQRGFDVLVVTLPPMELLFPKTGSHVLAYDILNYLMEHQEYEQVLVHAFSVGAYLLSEILVKLNQEDKTKYDNLMNRFTGIILDSAVDFNGIPKGFPRAVSKNPLLIRILELYTNTHLKLMHQTATQHYLKASHTFHTTSWTCPVLFIVSEDDPVGNPTDNGLLANDWRNLGVDVYFKCFKKSAHCSHMLKHPEEYAVELERFFNKIGLGAKANL